VTGTPISRVRRAWLRRRARQGDLHAACELLRRGHPLLADLTDEQLITAHVRLSSAAIEAGTTAADAARALLRVSRIFDDAPHLAARRTLADRGGR
jgi:hypothetical protein